MKHLFTLLLPVIIFISCQKEHVEPTQSKYLLTVKEDIKQKLSESDYSSLDFQRSVVTRMDSSHNFLRIAFKGKNMTEDFVLLKTSAGGSILNGRIVHLVRHHENTYNDHNRFTYNGSITISPLNRKSVFHSSIVGGYIMEFQTNNQKSSIASVMSLEAPGVSLPQVLVYAYRHTDGRGGSSLGTMVNLQSLLSEMGSSNYGNNYYSPMYNYGGGGSGGNGYGGYNSHNPYSRTENAVAQPHSELIYEEPIKIDFENNLRPPAIEVEKYLKCFETVPDHGATCSIEILTDIPIDGDPNKLFNWQTGSPGHTFIQIKKINGNQSIMQNIGFYPDQAWKVTLTPAPVNGRFADNSGHEFNASLKMDITPAQLQTVLTEIRSLSRFIKYDIDEYNCTDFALDVFNSVRSKPLEVPMYEIPGGMTAKGSRTPQGLYNQLKSMKQTNSSEAANITIPGKEGWVANSNGPCN